MNKRYDNHSSCKLFVILSLFFQTATINLIIFANGANAQSAVNYTDACNKARAYLSNARRFQAQSERSGRKEAAYFFGGTSFGTQKDIVESGDYVTDALEKVSEFCIPEEMAAEKLQCELSKDTLREVIGLQIAGIPFYESSYISLYGKALGLYRQACAGRF